MCIRDRNTSIQVFGIVESGINLITYYHNKYNASHIILLGTETTISSGIHKKRLIEAGIDPHVIIPQECRLLESEIQIDSDSQIVENMINGFIEEAESKIDTEIKCVFTVLCCTHYFFSKHVFKRILTKKFNSLFILLDPNEQMAESVIYELEQFKTNEDKFGSCKIKNEVYSKVRLYDKEILLLGNQLKAFSPHLQDALKNYIHKEDLIDI
jgi:glutamate racemase